MMNNLQKNAFRFYLQTLSPLHIGCNEVYEPTGFVMDAQSKQLLVFDPLAFIAGLEAEDRKKFSDICRKGTILSILEIYKFFQGKSAFGRSIYICEDFINHYTETLSIPLGEEKTIQRELNRFLIERTAFKSNDGRPYLPGSAVKGALRTAYLNAMAEKKKVPAPKGKGFARELEKMLLDGGSFETDPFRLVKASDFMPVGNVKTRVVYAVNEKKVASQYQARGPYQILEVIEPGAIFTGQIRVEQPHSKARIRTPVSDGDLHKLSKRFYLKEKQREDEELKRIGISSLPTELDDKKESLLRLGRHSGAESMTISPYRNIRIMTDKGHKSKYLDHATTIWLAAEVRKPTHKKNLQPFGWVKWEKMTEQQADEFEQKEFAWLKETEAEALKHQAEIQKQIEKERKAAEAVKKRAAEEKQLQQEKQKKAAELAAMSPEQRDIAILRDPDVIENQVVEIYNKMDNFSEKNKKELSLALKDYWVDSGKWNKKDCTKKQWKKVQKVKKILNEF